MKDFIGGVNGGVSGGYGLKKSNALPRSTTPMQQHSGPASQLIANQHYNSQQQLPRTITPNNIVRLNGGQLLQDNVSASPATWQQNPNTVPGSPQTLH